MLRKTHLLNALYKKTLFRSYWEAELEVMTIQVSSATNAFFVTNTYPSMPVKSTTLIKLVSMLSHIKKSANNKKWLISGDFNRLSMKNVHSMMSSYPVDADDVDRALVFELGKPAIAQHNTILNSIGEFLAMTFKGSTVMGLLLELFWSHMTSIMITMTSSHESDQCINRYQSATYVDCMRLNLCIQKDLALVRCQQSKSSL